MTTQGLLLTLGVVPFAPRYVIPISGMIVGNVMVATQSTPLHAVRYQLMILFCILAGAAMKTIVVAFLTYPKLFTPYQQLRTNESLLRN